MTFFSPDFMSSLFHLPSSSIGSVSLKWRDFWVISLWCQDRLISNLLASYYMCPPLSLSRQGPNSFGLLFDIDGVLVRGRTPIPAAKQCFRNLVDRNGKYKVPVVFVTNAGNCMRQAKAEHLSHLLDVEVKLTQTTFVISKLSSAIVKSN